MVKVEHFAVLSGFGEKNHDNYADSISLRKWLNIEIEYIGRNDMEMLHQQALLH